MSVNHSKYTMTQIKSDVNDISIINNIPIISENCRITDSRQLKDFKDQTFGGYNISQASLALDKAIMEDKLEPALHWTIQLFLSGIIGSLWSKLITFASKQINIYNPKLPEFIYNKNLQWYSIIDNSKFTKDNILLLRNHPTLRLLLAEIIAILVLAKKHKINQLPKIKKEEFIIDKFKSKLEAKDNRLVENIITDGDPSEIRIAINEMAYHIYNKCTNKALYWMNWIIEWEKINSKKYGKYECASRNIDGVDAKYYKDVVWLIWFVIHKIKQLNISSTKFSGLINIGNGSNGCNGNERDKQIQALWKLYTYKFTPASRAKKQSYIIWSILYLTETIDYSIPLVDKPKILFQSILGFDKIFSTLKSQQVYNVINKELMNVVVEDNYMKPEKHKDMQEFIKRKEIEKAIAQKVQFAKQKKINIESLDKITEISKLDKYLFA
jgi:hypothetical protein